MGGDAVAALKAPDWPIYGEEEKRRLLTVLESRAWSSSGEMEIFFNEAWAAFSGSKYSLLLANGTVALQLACEALDVGAGDEVLIPGLTWQATATAALDVNAVPVLVDIDPATWCIDPKAANALGTPRTKAIIVVHLYGCTAVSHPVAAMQPCAQSRRSVIFWRLKDMSSRTRLRRHLCCGSRSWS